MKTKVIFFDFNGVISYNNFWNSIYSENHEFYRRKEEINDFIFKANVPLVKEWMVGKHNSEDIHNFIEENLKIPKDVLFPIFEKDARELDVSYQILDVIKNLKSKYKVVMITDNMDSFDRFTLESHPELIEIFDAIYNSYNTGLLKKQNDGEIFKTILQEFRADMKDAILIDDSKSNCELITYLGGKAINITGEKEVLNALETLNI